MWAVLKHHKLKSGYEVSLTFNEATRCYEVDMWTPTDINHWTKQFQNKDAAAAEYKKWEND